MITAAEIIRSLDGRSRARQLAQLDGLLAPERAAVLEALAAIPPRAAVDLGKLIAEARFRSLERGPRHQIDGAGAFRFFVEHVATHEELVKMKRELRGGASPADAMAVVHGSRPFTDVDRWRPRDTDDEPKTPRTRLKRLDDAQGARDSDPRPDPAPTTSPRPHVIVHGGCLGGDVGRPHGCPLDADYGAWRDPAGRPLDDEEAQAEPMPT